MVFSPQLPLVECKPKMKLLVDMFKNLFSWLAGRPSCARIQSENQCVAEIFVEQFYLDRHLSF